MRFYSHNYIYGPWTAAAAAAGCAGPVGRDSTAKYTGHAEQTKPAKAGLAPSSLEITAIFECV